MLRVEKPAGDVDYRPQERLVTLVGLPRVLGSLVFVVSRFFASNAWPDPTTCQSLHSSPPMSGPCLTIVHEQGLTRTRKLPLGTECLQRMRRHWCVSARSCYFFALA
jgi:hypothetical protein